MSYIDVDRLVSELKSCWGWNKLVDARGVLRVIEQHSTQRIPFEELKKEANQQGYTLIKKQKYIPHVRCKCGKRGHIYHQVGKVKGVFIKCDTGCCDCQTNVCATEREAWKEWYRMSTGEEYEND